MTTAYQRVAKALDSCDWSGVPIGYKAIIQHAATLLLAAPVSPFRPGQILQWIGYEYRYVGQSSHSPECSVVERLSPRPELFYVETQILRDQNPS